MFLRTSSMNEPGTALFRPRRDRPRRLAALAIAAAAVLGASSACQAAVASPYAIAWLPRCDVPNQGASPEVVARTQCGMVTAPLDHLSPGKGRITLEIVRIQAKKTQGRKGVIFTNPGGPGVRTGGSYVTHLVGVWNQLASQAATQAAYRDLLDHYDVVELTPRGMGNDAATLLRCRSRERIVAVNDITEDRSPANVGANRYNAGVLARGCQAQPLAAYINTDQTARDMDLVRGLLRQDKLHYLGTSYGTWLGVWYAALFPDRVGRMVLDSNVDWTATLQDALLGWTPEKEAVFDRFVAQHAAQRPQVYRMGDDPAAIRAGFVALQPRVRAVARAEGYAMPERQMAARVLDRWLREAPGLDQSALQARADTHVFSPDAAVQASAGRQFSALVAAVFTPQFDDSIRPGRLNVSAEDSVRSTVLCNDSVYSDDAFWARTEAAYAAAYPVGGARLQGRHCTRWQGARPLRPSLQRLARLDSLLMVQAEFDDQTPAWAALRAFDRTPNARMVLLEDTYLHGVSFSNVSPCVDYLVGRYLAFGTRPPRFTACRSGQ